MPGDQGSLEITYSTSPGVEEALVDFDGQARDPIDTHQHPNLDLGGSRVLETPATDFDVNETLRLESEEGDDFRFLGAMAGKQSRFGLGKWPKPCISIMGARLACVTSLQVVCWVGRRLKR